MRRGPRSMVYVSGPITKGDSFVNVNRACEVWRYLTDNGILAFCPHWSAIQQMSYPIGYEDWIEYDLAIIDYCTAVVRIPGESEGADREVNHARESGIPVFDDVAICVRMIKEMGHA